MVLIILASVLIAAIALYQAMHGAFSAIIMATLSVLCAVVALNYFEPLGLLLMGRLGAHAQGLSLLALFILPLLGSRVLADRFIAGNVVLTAWPDRIGGGACGVITALTLVGILTIVLYLLPLPATIFTYQPYDATLAAHHVGPPQWAAKFTLGLAKHLSAGPMKPIGQGRDFAWTHDDLAMETFCLRNRPPGGRAWAPADSMEITDAYLISPPPRGTPTRDDRATILAAPKYSATPPLAETKVLVVRVRVDELARSKRDNWYRLPATHFRLLSESGKSFYPVDYLTHAGVWRLNAKRDQKDYSKIAELLVARPWSQRGGPKQLVIDWVYRLPRSEQPWAIIFRRVCWADMPQIIDALPQAFDQDRNKVALSIKPAVGGVRFSGETTPADRDRLVQPKVAVASNMLPHAIRNIRLHNDPSQWPESLKSVKPSGQGQLTSADISAPKSDLYEAPKTGSTTILKFQALSKYMIVQFEYEVNKDFRVNSTNRPTLMKMTPRLLLDDGSTLLHYGAYLVYRPQQQSQVRLYYDYQRWVEGGIVKPDLATKLLDNVRNVESLGFVFVVPVNERRSVVGMDLGVGPEYEFHTPSPLATRRSR